MNTPLSLTDLPSCDLFLRPPPEQLFHYTSLDGASGIITSKSLHLTRVAHLSDLSELKFAIGLLRAAIGRAQSRLRRNDHRDVLEMVAKRLETFERVNICVASFCEEPDLLSQWRSYGKSGRGAALGFSRRAFEKINATGWAKIVRCIYDPEQQRGIADELVMMALKAYDMIDIESQEMILKQSRDFIIGSFYSTFLRVAPALKNHHFSEEKEWRIVTSARSTLDSKFRAQVSSSRVSEFYVYEFEKGPDGKYDFFESIVVGPTTDSELIRDAILQLCGVEGVAVKEIRSSHIPYRG